MRVGKKHYKTVWFSKGTVYLIDQHKLPFKFKIVRSRTYQATAKAIKDMVVRGAGAIGVTAGFGLVQAVYACPLYLKRAALLSRVKKAKQTIDSTRPTARNLFYATERVWEAVKANAQSVLMARRASEREALSIAKEDEEAGKTIGMIGEKLIHQNMGIMTHCNAGWLAFSDWGTALAPLYVAKRKGKKFFVFCNETRPRSQGANLTAWELGNEAIPHAVVADTSAGSLMQQKRIQMIIVGADRIAANGDVANKIGTYQVAVLAKENNIPFYVAAPLATFDKHIKSGRQIPIEKRSGNELFNRKWFKALQKSKVENFAFDITPARYIKGIITERGIIRANRHAIQKNLS
jgi:methylthioribose-1-phosphate isomerase